MKKKNKDVMIVYKTNDGWTFTTHEEAEVHAKELRKRDEDD